MTSTMEPSEDLTAQVNAEIDKLNNEGKLEVRVNYKCRICSDEPTRMLVNNLIARLLTYQDIFRILDSSINPARKTNGQRPITRRIIKTHAEGHFDIDNPARAVWRAIGLKRAEQLKRDHIEGIGGVVTTLGYLETVMQRGYETLVQPDTPVHYMDGMKAAVQLAEIESKTQGEQRTAEMLAEMSRVIAAVKDTVPAEMWPAIIAKVSGEIEGSTTRSLTAGESILDVDEEDLDEEDMEEYDPGEDEDYEGGDSG